MTENKQVFDEQLVNLFKKIEIPKNPLSFYFNITKIENDLSDSLTDYFYKAVNEFISPTEASTEWTFLDKLYYYSSFFENIIDDISNLLEKLKYYDMWTYVYCMNVFDKKIKYKAIAFIENRPDMINMIDNTAVEELDKNNLFKEYLNKEDFKIFSDFEKYFYSLDEKKDKFKIDFLLNSIYVNIYQYDISYKKVHLSFDEFQTTENYHFYESINYCFAHIIQNYDRNLEKQNNLINRIIDTIDDKKKNYYISRMIHKYNDEFLIWKNLHKDIKKGFSSEKEFIKYLITYLVDKQFKWLKKIFYWEAIKDRLSENDWAKIWWINLFYLQKIDKNIANFDLLLFSKQFKDSIIESYNSISWAFIKPYFYYILVFKSIKLPLKDWQKLFFLLMFFSAENYSEYVILQNIMTSIERIWLWDFSESKSKIWYYIKRIFILFSEFYSSIVLLVWLVFLFWFFGLINILMMWTIFLLFIVSWLKYIFFPWRFEILRTIWMIVFVILSYTWFTVVFPKVSQPQYISFVWKQVQSLVSLNFSWTKQNYKDMISFVYWKNYKKFESNLLTTVYNKIYKIKDNKQVKNLVKNTTQLTTDIIKKYQTKWIALKRWTYLKYYIDKEIRKMPIPIKKRNELSKKIVKQYVKWYCSQKNDIYCKTYLERLPVWFEVNITKIDELIKKNY